ncbi:MAG: flippase [Patescibacteria group bacterium]
MIRRILGNTIWISLSQGIGKLAAFILLIFIARYLGDEMYGKFSFAMSLVGILVVVADFGMGVLLIREVARKKELTKKYLENILVLKMFFSVIAYGLIYLCLIILQKDEITVQLTILAGIFIVINSFELLFYTVFRAWEKMKFEAITKIIYDFSLLGIGMLFIWKGFSAQMLMTSYIIATCISFIISFTFIRKYFTKFKLEFDFSFSKKILKQSWPFALSSIFIILYFKIDTVMLSSMRSDQEVGWYNAAYNLVFALFMIPTVFDIIFYPILSKAFSNKSEFKYVCKKLFTYAICIAIPAGLLVFFLREPLVNIIYADKYPLAIPILGILVWSFIINFINRFHFIINSANLQILITKQMALGVLLNIGLNFFLIPKYGTIGAAWATVAAEILGILVLSYYALIKYRKKIFYDPA